MTDSLAGETGAGRAGAKRRLPRGSARLAIRRAWHGFVRHRGIDAAAALTFFMTLASFPGALAVATALALGGDRERAVNDLLAFARVLLPDDVAGSLAAGFEQLLGISHPGIVFAVALALLLWTTSGYATAFGRAVNTVYGVQEGRPFWTFRGSMLLVAAVLVVVGAATVVTLLGTPDVMDDILGRRGIAPAVTTVWTWVRIPLLLALAMSAVAVLVTLTPNVRHPRIVWVSVGSAFAIGVWLIATVGYAVYVVLIGAYGALYGSIGVLLVALLWAYLTNLALVAGVELDAEFVRMRQLARGIEAEEHIRVPVRDVRRDHWLATQTAADIADARRIREHAAEGDQ